MRFTYDDGGRAAAGFKGHTGDCVVRAISIATYPFCDDSGMETPGEHYREVYDALHDKIKDTGKGKARGKKGNSSRNGVPPDVFRPYLESLGWVWHATMGIGTGCRVHLAEGELPRQPHLIVRLSRHLAAVVDGNIHDTHDPSRVGTRCVYGYFALPPRPKPQAAG